MARRIQDRYRALRNVGQLRAVFDKLGQTYYQDKASYRRVLSCHRAGERTQSCHSLLQQTGATARCGVSVPIHW